MANEKDLTDKTITPEQTPGPEENRNGNNPDPKNNGNPKRKKENVEEEKVGEEMPEGTATKPSLFERLHDLLSKVRRFVHHILHPQPDSQIIPKRRKPFERRHVSEAEQEGKEDKDTQKKEEQEQDVNGKKDAKEKASKESAERKNPENDARTAGDGSDEVTRMQAQAQRPKRSSRDYGNLFYHIIARIGLGKEGYMHAVEQAEKREAAEERAAKKNLNEKENPSSGKAEKGDKETSGEKPETGQSKADSEQTKPEPEKPLKHLYEVFTKDTAESNKFLANYEKRLAQQLKIIGHQNVDVHATRADGMITFDIACERDAGGTQNTFMAASNIHVTMDSNYDVIEAFASEGNEKFDVTETLGKYIAADIAGNFREDYNRYDDVHNVLSENRFMENVQNMTEGYAVPGKDGTPGLKWYRTNFDPQRIDNVLYEITASKEKDGISRMLTFTPINKDGKSFTVPGKEWLEHQELPRTRFESIQKAIASCHEYQQKCEAYNHLKQELKTARTELAKGRALEGQTAQDDPAMQQIVKNNKSLHFACKQKNEQMQQLQAEIAESIQKQFGQSFPEPNIEQMQAYLGQKLQEETVNAEKAEAECQKIPPREELEQTVREAFKTARAAHLENVTKERQEIRHIFDDILPTAKDGPFNWHLKDLSKAAENPDKTLQDILEPEQEERKDDQERTDQEPEKDNQEQETDEQEHE